MRGLVPVISFVVLGGVALVVGAYAAANPAWCGGDKQACIPGVTVPDNAHAADAAVLLFAYAIFGLAILVAVANALLWMARSRAKTL